MSPIGALVLQWHTKVKYITDLPLVYTMGFMAVDNKAFSKISPADQKIVREVMTRTYSQLNEANVVDNEEALQALLNTGIEMVALSEEEVIGIRDILRQSNRDMAEKGDFSLEMYEQMLQYLQEYRTDGAGAAGN